MSSSSAPAANEEPPLLPTRQLTGSFSGERPGLPNAPSSVFAPRSKGFEETPEYLLATGFPVRRDQKPPITVKTKSGNCKTMYKGKYVVIKDLGNLDHIVEPGDAHHILALFPRYNHDGMSREAPDGIYNWIVFSSRREPALEKFMAARSDDKFEIASGHQSLSMTKEVGDDGKVWSAGELVKKGGRVAFFNVRSGTFSSRVLHKSNMETSGKSQNIIFRENPELAAREDKLKSHFFKFFPEASFVRDPDPSEDKDWARVISWSDELIDIYKSLGLQIILADDLDICNKLKQIEGRVEAGDGYTILNDTTPPKGSGSGGGGAVSGAGFAVNSAVGGKRKSRRLNRKHRRSRKSRR